MRLLRPLKPANYCRIAAADVAAALVNDLLASPSGRRVMDLGRDATPLKFQVIQTLPAS